MADPNNNHQDDQLELDPADGQQYINELRERLLVLISCQQTVEDVEDRMRKLYPQSQVIDQALRDAKEARKPRTDTLKPLKNRQHSSSSSSASFTGALHNFTSFAVTRLSNLVKSSNEVDKFKLAVIENIIADVLKLAGGFVKRQKNFIITRSDIRTAMYADKDLVDIFLSDDKSLLLMGNHPIFATISSTDNSSEQNYDPNMTYKAKVKEIADAEDTFSQGLKLIIKVFKAQLQHSSLHHIAKDIDLLFCNVEELLELSTMLLTSFQDALESIGQSEDSVPYVGAEIFELAQAEEFQSYFVMAYKRLSRDEMWSKAYQNIISNESTMNALKTAGQNFDLAVKHLLPNYLTNTIVHFFVYYRNFNDLYELSKRNNNLDDQLALKETISILIRTKKAIEALLEKEIDRTTKEVEALDQGKAESIRKELKRRLDAELEYERNQPLPFMPPSEEYIFSEPDTKDNIIFEESQRANNTHPMLDTSLNHNHTGILSNNSISTNANHSIINNINNNKHLIEQTLNPPVIKSATLIKLVERLTYHEYRPNIVEDFLITYRAFISNPGELLELLIKRYRIPDPPLRLVCRNFTGSLDDLTEADRTAYRQYLRRFRQEYSKPVKMRVVNVLKSWTKNHYYDFKDNNELLAKLNEFLDEILDRDRVLKIQVDIIRNTLKQMSCKDRTPPRLLIEEEGVFGQEDFDRTCSEIMNIDPIEFAKQLTLIEFELFRAIKPFELITVSEKSPNRRRMGRHYNRISYWIQKCLVEMPDPERRITIFAWALDVMGVLRELNNFNGLLSIGCALGSSAVRRLECANVKLYKKRHILEDYLNLTGFHMKVQEQLRHCNPPCIPFLGDYSTKLLHAKEGNRTFVGETVSPTLSSDSNSPITPMSARQSDSQQFFAGGNQICDAPRMINFAKQRISAGLVKEFGNFQNLPYNFKEEPKIMRLIKSIEFYINRFAKELLYGRGECNVVETDEKMYNLLEEYIYAKAEEIEPKKDRAAREDRDKPKVWPFMSKS